MVTIQTIATVRDSTADSDTIQCQEIKIRVGANTHIYQFYCEPGTNDVGFKKSTDGGASYGAFQIVNSTGTWQQVVAFYDKWAPSPGNTGDLIHLAAVDIASGDLRYFSIDTASSDAVGGNTLIVNFTSINSATSGCPTITKAANGDLFAAAVGITPAGVLVGKSTNGGTSFTDVTGGGANDFDEALDNVMLVPLITDNDVLLIGVRTTETDIRSVVYDNSVTDAFEGTSVLIDTGAFPTAGLSQNFGVTFDQTSGDTYLVYMNGNVSLADTPCLFRSYSESTRTWSSSNPVIHTSPTGEVNIIRGDRMGINMCRDQTDGIMCLSILAGNAVAAKIVYLLFSSDDGINWSDPIRVPTVPDEDFRKTQQSMIMLDQAEGWHVSFFREDNNALVGLVATIPLEFTAAVNFDDDATTPKSGSKISLEEIELRYTVGDNFGGRRPYMGSVLSDGSGNWKILSVPRFTDEASPSNPDHQAVSYTDNGGPSSDEMDLNREHQPA